MEYESSVGLSVRPSLSFLQIGSLVFSLDIIKYLVTDEVWFLKRKLAARIWAQGA